MDTTTTAATFLRTCEKAVSFDSHTLVVPTLSNGTIGPLALDMFIHTLQLQHVGLWDDPTILPVIGNDVWTPQGTGVISCNMEVFQHPTFPVTVIQQRAPGYAFRFSTGLLSWARAVGISKVLLLHSSDARRRNDSFLSNQRSSNISWAISGTGTDNTIAQLKRLAIQPLDTTHFDLVFQCDTPSSCLFHECTSLTTRTINDNENPDETSKTVTSSIPTTTDNTFHLLALVALCYEGDNTPEAVALADIVRRFLGLPEPENGWIQPPSWYRAAFWGQTAHSRLF